MWYSIHQFASSPSQIALCRIAIEKQTSILLFILSEKKNFLIIQNFSILSLFWS